AITDDVMHGHEQHMIFSAETYETRADEWSSREIERQARLFRRAPLRFVLGGNINQGQFEYECRSNRLHGLGVHRGKTRAQTFMSPDDFIQRSPHRINLQVTTQSHRDGNVVERATRLQLMKEPETLLRERQRESSVARYSNDWRSWLTCLVAQSGFDVSGQIPDGRRFKQGAHGQLDPKAFTHTRHEARRQQGMS